MNTNFDGCTLDQVRWAGAVMSQSTFRGTHLKEAQLSKARCSYCDFEARHQRVRTDRDTTQTD